MTLRIMLMGLVASMGYDLPSGPDLSRWTQTGRDWVQARMADLSGTVVEAERPDLEPTDCHQAKAPVSIELSVIPESVKVEASDDSMFVAVSDAMASEFVADSISMTIRDEAVPVEDTPLTVASDAPPVGLPVGEESSAQVSTAVEAEPADVFKSDETTNETEEAPPQADRISSAVRLTREALQAWANLIPQSSDDSSSAR